MPDRLKTARQNAVHGCLRILTVLPTRGYRDAVEAVCRARDPGCAITHVSSVMDAVLALLTEPVDVLVVDMGLAGDLLEVLHHHVLRSAPEAKIALFMNEPQSRGAATGDLSQVHSWSELEETLARLFLDT